MARVAPGRAGPAPAAPTDGPAVDEAVFADLAADLGADHIGEVCRLFLDNATVAVDRVRQALDAGDTAGAVDNAHRLKSSSGFVGATTLAALCAAVEAGAAPAGAGELLAQELQRAAGLLDLLVERLSGGA
jgi:HPt (histidine-containing phosphotransfer) domain-containing protein